MVNAALVQDQGGSPKRVYSVLYIRIPVRQVCNETYEVSFKTKKWMGLFISCGCGFRQLGSMSARDNASIHYRQLPQEGWSVCVCVWGGILIELSLNFNRHLKPSPRPLYSSHSSPHSPLTTLTPTLLIPQSLPTHPPYTHPPCQII